MRNQKTNAENVKIKIIEQITWFSFRTAYFV